VSTATENRIARTVVFLRPSERAAIETVAEANGRSMSGEIAHLVRQHINANAGLASPADYRPSHEDAER
jgi:Arc-like DNA binding domain